MIYETKIGKLMGTRVISVEEGIPKIEVNISQEDRLKTSMDATSLVTFWSEQQKEGSIYAQGHCVLMLKDDIAATATWNGKGIGHYHDQIRRDVASVSNSHQCESSLLVTDLIAPPISMFCFSYSHDFYNGIPWTDSLLLCQVNRYS